MAVFNSAVSAFTFLRMENRIDNEFISLFERFSRGVDFIKGYDNFFKVVLPSELILMVGRELWLWWLKM